MYHVFPENGSSVTFVQVDSWIVSISRVYTEGTVFMKPAVGGKSEEKAEKHTK